ncbi:sulfite exporter TauE/SafE family protein [Candidatus Ruthia endofausta]|uniref:Sulfite exporter TauE/SafE family protein n=1 Tax=Candidatus Ruthia endofausta TaxID=2738852 RepID=A0A6N0HQC9_9GAMM|nr:sulfite exporter TauE/SafE family protein [Candidatus Ruthia endofausta]QKQ24460.1 sulfite exporter TauE/SafE family protein [Candidatus Ruthia endofausta]
MDIFISVFLMGLLGGVHCLGMCGGVVGMLSAGLDPQVRANPKKVVLFHLNYNLGRILSYMLMGTIFGLIGTLLVQTLQMNVFDKVLRIFSGVLMVMVGLYIGNWSSSIQILEKFGTKLWAKLQPLTQQFLPIRNLRSAFFTGLLWGAIPCGLVYGALSFAVLSGSMLEGGLIMLAFGLGTLPSLLLMASLSTQLGLLIQKPWIRRLSGLLIIVLGIMALWMPIKSMIFDTMRMNHSHGVISFFKPTDFDYLV